MIGKVECPLCGWSGKEFLPMGRVGRLARCPQCDSAERHRAMYLYLRDETPLFSGEPARVLHFAPERALREKLETTPGIEYVTTDLEMSDVDLHMDIGDLWFRDGVFDYVICSHVLEHVPDDLLAAREMRRVLREGGQALIMVPIVSRPGGKTHEDPNVVSPADRERLFGQRDHVRAFSYDFAERIAGTGFEVESVPMANRVGRFKAARLGLEASDQVFVCRPPAEPQPDPGPGEIHEPSHHEPSLPLPPKRLRFMGETDESFKEIGDTLADCVAQYADLGPSTRMLDIGCGYGRLPHALLRGGYEGSYLGIDVQKAPVAWCQKELGSDRFEFRLSDLQNAHYNPKGKRGAAELDLENQQFDVITAFSVFTHMWPEDVSDYLDVIRGLLPPGGLAIATLFLFDPEWHALRTERRIPRVFEHEHTEYCRYEYEDGPLRRVGYELDWVLAEVERADLEPARWLSRGTWSQRPLNGHPSAGYQDTLVLRRAGEGAALEA